MDGITAVARGGSRLGRLTAFARSRPGTALAIVLGTHLVVWTLLPMLVCPNLQLDLAEDLALGREWQLGYWKHPPLPWWAADFVYRLTGTTNAVYVLGPLAAVACMYFVWRLARDVVGPAEALVAVLALEGLHFFNFSVVKFAHDQMQLPFWALTGWLFYRALTAERLRDWALAGAFLALAFWSKYAAFALAGTLGLFLLIDPKARRAWRTPGPYVMAAAFLIVLAPNLWWLVDSGFQPFVYVDERARAAKHFYQYLWYPLRWTASQISYLLPVMALLTLALRDARIVHAASHEAWARRYVTTLAFGPFLLTTAIAAVSGRLPVAMWGYPLWSFAPLAVVMWWRPLADMARLRHFTAAFLGLFLLMPTLYGGLELFEPFFRDRAKATQFPGQLLADTITRQWRELTGTPLRYVSGVDIVLPGGPDSPGGGEQPANNVAVYSADRPQVLVHADPQISPWIDMEDLRRRGTVILWEQPELNSPRPTNFLDLFPTAQFYPPLVLPRQTLYPRQPAIVGRAFVLPQP